MSPSQFPEANVVFGSPSDLPGSCQPIHAFQGQVQGGIFDGSQFVITAWKPTPEELRVLNEGGSVYLCVMGGLPPHYLTTSFEEASHT